MIEKRKFVHSRNVQWMVGVACGLSVRDLKLGVTAKINASQIKFGGAVSRRSKGAQEEEKKESLLNYARPSSDEVTGWINVIKHAL